MNYNFTLYFESENALERFETALNIIKAEITMSKLIDVNKLELRLYIENYELQNDESYVSDSYNELEQIMNDCNLEDNMQIKIKVKRAINEEITKDELEDLVNEFIDEHDLENVDEYKKHYFDSSFYHDYIVLNNNYEISIRTFSQNSYDRDESLRIYEFTNQQDFANTDDIPCFHDENIDDVISEIENNDRLRDEEKENKINELREKHDDLFDFISLCCEHVRESCNSAIEYFFLEQKERETIENIF